MADDDLGTQLITRYNTLKAERYNFDWRWEEMAPFVAPSRIGIRVQYPPGLKQTRLVYDSTTMMAAELMAMFIAGHLINPSQQWFGLTMRNPVLQGSDAIQEWLEDCRDRQLTAMGRSLFYAEGPESLIDYVGFGTGFLLCEERPQPVNEFQKGFRGMLYQAKKTGRFVLAEGPDGLVDTVMDEFKMTVRSIRDRWEKTGNLSEKVRHLIAEKKLDATIEIIHAIEPRPLKDQRGGAGAKAMPWRSVWVERDSKHVIAESGYPAFPAAVPRYHRTPGEVYGRGRGDLAFPDTWTLNTAKKMGLEDWALKIRPPVLVKSNAVIGNLKLVPGGPTSVNTQGGSVRDAISALETGSHPEVSQLKEEELRKSIRQIFYVDQILALMEVSKSEMTAFEFAKKIELLFRLLGPVYGRLEWEYLNRVVSVTFETMLAAGAFAPPPQEIFDTDGQIDVDFQNPLAKAQRSGDAEALTMATNDLAPLVQMKPELMDWLDTDKATPDIMSIRGMPARWTRSIDEVATLRKTRAQAQAQQEELAQAGQVADAMGKAAPMVKAMAGKAGAAA